MNEKQDKGPVSSRNIGCFTGDELLAYKTGGLPAGKRSGIFYHLNVEKCPRCRELYALVEPSGQEEEGTISRDQILQRLKEVKVVTSRSRPSPSILQKGQIWTTRTSFRNARGELIDTVEASFPVLIVSEGNATRAYGNIIRVIPISFDTEYNNEPETVLLSETSPLGYSVLLEIFNERAMLAGNLEEYRGSLSRDDLNLVVERRAQFLEGRVQELDEEYLAWREKELTLTAHLSLPVNEALWGEEGPEETIEVFIEAYRRAADVSEEELSDVMPHLLSKGSGAILGIVQVRDRVLLRHVVVRGGEVPVPVIRVEGEPLSLKRKGPGVYEAILGYAGDLPDKIQIAVETKEEHRLFHVFFRKKVG